MRDLRSRGHEVNNVLSAALLSTELFLDLCRPAPTSPARAAEFSGAVDEMVHSLQRMTRLIDSGRRAETTATPGSRLVEPVGLFDTVHRCVARLRELHPRTELVVHEPEAEARHVRVAVCAGELGLFRALDAVVSNACAGDAVRRASRVELRLGVRSEVDVVALEISDDGPGFTQAQLGKPISAFETENPDSLGLGLYTAERIARASGGSLRRANADSGGALVTVYFAVASEPALPQ